MPPASVPRGQGCRPATPPLFTSARRCDSRLVYPVDWAPAESGRWRVDLRCPDCEWTGGGVYSPGDRRRASTRSSTAAPSSCSTTSRADRARTWRSRSSASPPRCAPAGSSPKTSRRPRRRLGVALDDPVGDQRQQLAPLRVEPGVLQRSLGRLRRGSRRPRAPSSSTPVAAIRSQTASAVGLDRARADRARASAGSRSRARISGMVTVPSSRSVPRALPVRSRRAGDVEDVVEELEGEADLAAEDAQRLGAVAAPGRRRSGRRTRTAGPSSAGSAPGSDRRVIVEVEGVAALGELALGEADRGAGEQRNLALAASSSPASSAKARENSRSPTAVAVRARPVRDHRRPAAAQRGRVEDVVVDERRHVDELDRGRGAHRRRRRPRRPAQTRTSIGRRRLPPAASVAAGLGREPVAARRRRSRRAAPRPPPSSAAASSAAASRTWVTGGGTCCGHRACPGQRRGPCRGGRRSGSR